MNLRPNVIPATHAACWAVASMLLSAGCQGSDFGVVTGKAVRKDGTPVVGARVIARSEATGKTAVASTNNEGHFQLTAYESDAGIPPGEYRVIIMEGREELGVRGAPTIAAKYGNATSSGLTFVVVAGEERKLDLSLDPPTVRR